MTTMNEQRSLFDNDYGTCPECGGAIAIVDDIGPVGRCESCDAVAIRSRGRWREFRAYFGGGPARPQPKSTRRNRRRAAEYRYLGPSTSR